MTTGSRNATDPWRNNKVFTSHLLMRILVALILVALASPASAQTSGATYRVTFTSSWSAATHPAGFPSNPHFSGLVGSTHDGTTRFWQEGQPASAGIEDMAERGVKSTLLSEITAAGSVGGAQLSGGGIPVSPGTVSLEFDIDPAHPYVTLVSMLAPSPDWFVGVSGLDLRDGSGWNQRVEVELHVYDAGTDSGSQYTSADIDTVPPDVIKRLVTTPFDQETRVGTFVFERVGATAVEGPGDMPGEIQLGAPYPNPAIDRFTVPIDRRSTERGEVVLYDLLGRPVLRQDVDASTRIVEFRVAGLPAGLYLVRANRGRVRTLSVIR